MPQNNPRAYGLLGPSLLGLGAGLLSQGYTRSPQTGFEGLGRGLGLAQQFRNQAQEQQLQERAFQERQAQNTRANAIAQARLGLAQQAAGLQAEAAKRQAANQQAVFDQKQAEYNRQLAQRAQAAEAFGDPQGLLPGLDAMQTARIKGLAETAGVDAATAAYNSMVTKDDKLYNMKPGDTLVNSSGRTVAAGSTDPLANLGAKGQQQVRSIDTAIEALNELEGQVKKGREGTWSFLGMGLPDSPSKVFSKDRLGTDPLVDNIYHRWLMAQKGADELGALQGPDISMLQAQVENPNNLSTISPRSLFVDPMTQIAAQREALKRQRARLTGQTAAAPQGTAAVSKVLTSPSGRKATIIND